MNTRPVFSTSPGPAAHHVAFNDNHKYFSVGHDDGFSVFTSESCERHIEQDTQKSIGAAAMLGSTQIIILLGGGSYPAYPPNKAVLYDTNKSSEVAAISTSKTIITATMSSRFIALVSAKSTNLYKHGDKIEKIATYETATNPLGLCCLGEKFLLLPGRSPGQLQLVDLKNLRIDIVPSHTTPLRALCLSPDESVVASASETGTLIRIHSTASNARLAELRRGVTPATIYSLDISPSGRYLAVTSDTSTLHIFALPYVAAPATEENDSKLSPSQASNSRHSASPIERSPSPSGSQGITAGPSTNATQKWGSLAKLPFAPRVFTDVYSLASATFDPGKEGEEDMSTSYVARSSSASRDPTILAEERKPPKGVVGWINDETLVVVSAGKEARYERFMMTRNQAGKKIVVRVGWSRYMQPS